MDKDELWNRYLACDGFPEKEDVITGFGNLTKEKEKDGSVNGFPRGIKHELLCQFQDGYINGAVNSYEKCKLAHLKEKERLLDRLSVEKIEEIIIDSDMAHMECSTETTKELATALRKLIEEEGK